MKRTFCISMSQDTFLGHTLTFLSVLQIFAFPRRTDPPLALTHIATSFNFLLNLRAFSFSKFLQFREIRSHLGSGPGCELDDPKFPERNCQRAASFSRSQISRESCHSARRRPRAGGYDDTGRLVWVLLGVGKQDEGCGGTR